MSTVPAQKQINPDPDSAKIITSDLDHFWKVFDLLEKQSTTEDSLKILQSGFVSRVSTGLEKYMKAANCYAACYLSAIRSRKKDYLAIRYRSELLKNKKDTIIGYLQHFKRLYPALRIPVICLTIGKFEVGGSQFDNTLFIGCELDLLENIDVPVQIIHELAHFQQKSPDPKSNIDLAVIEGGAEFICFQVTGQRTLASAWNYGLANEDKLWLEFRPKKDSAIDMHWFLDKPDTTANKPGSLGYFIGYEICNSYLQTHNNKKAAMTTLIEMAEPKKIYQASEYMPGRK